MPEIVCPCPSANKTPIIVPPNIPGIAGTLNIIIKTTESGAINIIGLILKLPCNVSKIAFI